MESDETKHEQQNGDVTSRTENGEGDQDEDITEEDDSSREKTNPENEGYFFFKSIGFMFHFYYFLKCTLCELKNTNFKQVFFNFL